MKRGVFSAILLASCLSTAWAVAPASATSSRSVTFTGVTVTAAKESGDSAVVMSIVNRSGGAISVASVTSAVSGMAMLYFDDNMCQGDTAMTWLSNILITTGRTQKLGYRYQGVMLAELHQKLVVGESVPLVVHWTDFHSTFSTTVTARVVKPPKGLHFRMSSMKM